MTSITILFVITLFAGFYMTWSIGANDVANAVGTGVGSKALTLKQAVVLAAIMEFSGAFFFGSHVTHTIEGGVVNAEFFQQDPIILVFGMLAVLLGAGTWLVVASYYGLPVSTTHSIVGAMVGFGIALGGLQAIYWNNVGFIATSWIVSPLLGGFISYGVFNCLRKVIFFSPNPIGSLKKIAPLLVFVFISIFASVFFYQDFEKIDFHPTFPESILYASLVGFAGALCTFFFVKGIHVPELETTETVQHPDLLHEVTKTKRYLKRLQSHSKGKVQQKISKMVGEFEDISEDVVNSTYEELQVPDFQIVERVFAKLQIMSAGLMAFSHGANDVANAIGPLSVATNVLLEKKFIPNTPVSIWLLALGGFGIILGLATWGWRVIETIGKGITELTPTRGFAAEFGAATTIIVASRMGFPISATHTLVGAVLGVGFARGLEALNLNTLRDVVISWIVTIPVGAISAICFFYAIQAVFT